MLTGKTIAVVAALALAAFGQGAAAPLAVQDRPSIEGTVDAAAAFNDRQADLVTLAGHFGALHRLRQLCTVGSAEPDLFRNHMRALVPLEAPTGRTKLDMIAAFNAAYREVSREHLTCSVYAEELYQARAAEALVVTDRLAKPFDVQ